MTRDHTPDLATARERLAVAGSNWERQTLGGTMTSDHDHDPDLDSRLDALRVYAAILDGDAEAADHVSRGTACPSCLAVACAQAGLMIAGWAGGDTRNSGGRAALTAPFVAELRKLVAEVRRAVEDDG